MFPVCSRSPRLSKSQMYFKPSPAGICPGEGFLYAKRADWLSQAETKKQKNAPRFYTNRSAFCLERAMGIEPTSSAWKADILADVRCPHRIARDSIAEKQPNVQPEFWNCGWIPHKPAKVWGRRADCLFTLRAFYCKIGARNYAVRPTARRSKIMIGGVL